MHDRKMAGHAAEVEERRDRVPDRRLRASSRPPPATGPIGVGTVLALVVVIPAVMLCDQVRRRAWRHRTPRTGQGPAAYPRCGGEGRRRSNSRTDFVPP
jgi:hypothetical protein